MCMCVYVCMHYKNRFLDSLEDYVCISVCVCIFVYVCVRVYPCVYLCVFDQLMVYCLLFELNL